MNFIKKHIFGLARFINIWMLLSSIYDLVNQQIKTESAIFNIIMSTLGVIIVIMAEIWYKEPNYK